MGFMDFVKSMFGIGGCTMELALDAPQVPVGGVLSGRCTIVGADKEYPLTAVKVQLLYVHVESQEGSALPKIDTRVMIDNTLANNEVIPAKGSRTYDFTLQIPGGTEPTAHNVSYTVMVTADIPGLKDPSAKKDLKVVEAEEGSSTMSLDAIYSRWPALKGTAEGPLCDAIRDIGWSHSDWDESKNLQSLEPVLAKFLRHDAQSVRAAALESWSRVIGDNPTKENVATLKGYLEGADPTAQDTLEAIEAAARFGKVGGVEILQPFAKHEREEIRKRVAWAVGLHARDVGKGLMLLESMLPDPSLDVRVQVVESLSSFNENGVVMQKLAALAEPSTPVAIRRVLPYGLRSGWKFDDIVWPALRRLAADEDHEVRRKTADCLSSYCDKEGHAEVVFALLADADADVRREMAYEIRNFRDEAIPPFRDRLTELAESDDDREVRTSAIGSLARGRPVQEVVGYYRAWMAKEPSEPVLRGIVHGIKFETEPEYKAILKDIAGCDFPRVASEAKDGFEYNPNA